MTQEVVTMPVSLDEIKGFANAFVASGMFKDTKQLAEAIVKIQAGRELGLSPVYSMQNINLIRDRLTTSAGTIALLVKRSGRYNYHIKEHTDLKCTISFTESGKEAGESTFTMEDAKRALLVRPDSGWTKYPRAMLFSRAISQGARIYCPDAIGGVYTNEEMTAIDEVPVITSNSEEIPTSGTNSDTMPHADMVTEPQRRKIFALSKERGYTHEQVKDYIFHLFVKDSTKDLTKDEASQVIDTIEKCELLSHKK